MTRTVATAPGEGEASPAGSPTRSFKCKSEGRGQIGVPGSFCDSCSPLPLFLSGQSFPLQLPVLLLLLLVIFSLYKKMCLL